MVYVGFGGFNKGGFDMFLVHLWCAAAFGFICSNCDQLIV
jgi:hypothetical protein